MAGAARTAVFVVSCRHELKSLLQCSSLHFMGVSLNFTGCEVFAVDTLT